MTTLQRAANGQSFDEVFRLLTGNSPFPWQRELYEKWFSQGKFPASCNLPTGLGKTLVVAIWLISLARHPGKVPRRLVYVVNRRTVVDQTTDEVEKLRTNLREAGLFDELAHLCALPRHEDDSPLALSTLRGQFADNREWSADPCRPAVICGTVDMIGSRLLFSGYGVGFKSKPLHAGFLGQNVLLVHDEAHLEPAFQELLIAIENEQHNAERSEKLPWPRIRVMELSATSRGGDGKQSEKPFVLTKVEIDPPKVIPNPPTEPIHQVWLRLTAKKGIEFHPAKRDDVAKRIGELARRWKSSDKAILVFVRTIDDVKTVKKVLTDRKEGVPDEQVQVLTGTIRGLERDRLAKEDPVFARFLPNPKVTPQQGTVFLICTSAGEVGVDISADHMVCDLTTLDSMTQRLGRVNRRGGGKAEIDIVFESDPNPKPKSPEFESARWKTKEILEQLPKCDWLDSNDIQRLEGSPLSLRNVLHSDDMEVQKRLHDERRSAFAPAPTILPTADILFDAWAMTTIRDKMPGRPEVGPYLHGIAEELPQTTIAWRAELDLLANDPNPKAKLRTIFAKHRVRPHETVTVNSRYVIKFFETVTKKRKDLQKARVVIVFSRQLLLTTIGRLIENPGPLFVDPTLVLPASFGYLDDKGMLSADAMPIELNMGAMPQPLDIADIEGYEPMPDFGTRWRVLIERNGDGWTALRRLDGKPLADSIEPHYPKSAKLIEALRGSDFRVRLVQPIGFDDEGNAIRSLVALAPVRQQQQTEEQTLDKHVKAVEVAAQLLADRLQLPEPFRAALLFAATWHDEGKKAQIWQRYIGGKVGDPPLGKSAKWCDPRTLCGYRHEFGSLLRIEHPGQHQTACILPADPDVRDLALHLMAAHHGNARPHFTNRFDRDFTTQQSDQVHTDVIRRFARLQRKLGRWGLAKLESLLRTADAAASAGLETDDEADDLNGVDE